MLDLIWIPLRSFAKKDCGDHIIKCLVLSQKEKQRQQPSAMQTAMFLINKSSMCLRPTDRSLLKRMLSSKSTHVGPTLNCAKALVKAHERAAFTDILQADVMALQGIGPKHQEHLAKLRIDSVADLANYKFYRLAKAICVLAETEVDDGRLPDATMNVNKGLDKAYENLPLRKIAEAPVAALQGISDQAGETLGQMGVKTVADLASFKYCVWAEAMQTVAQYEQQVEQKDDSIDA